jgi:hypothetical protein
MLELMATNRLAKQRLTATRKTRVSRTGAKDMSHI